MTPVNTKEFDEEELLKILELAKEAEESIKQLCQMAAKHNYKWRKKLEARNTQKK